MPRSKYYSYIIHSLHKKLHGNIAKLTETHAIRDFSLALISVFLPIFLLGKGYTIFEVIFFEMFLFLSHAVFISVFYKLNARYGIKTIMGISFIFTIIFYGFLFSIDYFQSFDRYLILAILIVTSSLGDISYWSGFHLDFALKSNKKHKGEEMGILSAASIVARIISPLVGAILIVYFSFHFVFGIIIFLLMVATIPLLYSKNVKFPKGLSVKKALNPSNSKLITLFILEGFEGIASALIWPLFLFMMNFALTVIGGLFSLATLLSTVTSYISGRLSDKHKEVNVFKIGSFTAGASLIIRPFLNTSLGIFLVQSFGGLSQPLFRIPLIISVYEKARNEAAEVLMTRDIYINIGRAIFFLATILSIFVLGILPGLGFMLIAGGFSAVMAGFLARNLNARFV